MCTFLPEHANRRRSCRERKTRQDKTRLSVAGWQWIMNLATMQMQMQMQRKRKRKCEVIPKCEREIHIFS